MKSKQLLTALTLSLGLILALWLLGLGSVPVAYAAGPWYVAPGGNDGGLCTSGAPCATINGALAQPGFVAGDTIYVAIGTYTGTGNEVVLLDKNATLSGGWDTGFTTQSGDSTIDGEESRRGITVNSGVTAIVERFTAQNGFASYGGGIRNSGTLTLNNSTVSGNTANNGGGISNGSTLTLNNSTVSGNTANDRHGGGIYDEYGTLTLNNSAVSGNTAVGWGGGIYKDRGTLTLNNSTVSDNTGTGIYGGRTLTFNNSTVSGNTGTGIYNWIGNATLNNSTVSGNTGTGILNAGGWGAATVLQNTILAGNTAECSGTIGSVGYNLIGDTSGCTFTPGTGDLTDVSPNFGPLIGSPGYHPLLLGSPAIDAGNPAGCTDNLGNPLPTDQRGAVRVGRCDIGAYEYTTSGPPVSIYAFGGTPQHAPPSSVFESPLQVAVLDSIGSPVSNTLVAFSAPGSGASGTFTDSGTFTTTAVTTESGIATAATFTANGVEASYTVTAMASGIVTPATFLLSNIRWYISPSGNDSNDCLSPATTCATLTGPLGKTGFFAGDTVVVASGTYTGTGNEVVLLDKGVTLSGGWNGTFTTQSGASIIDGQGSRRGITINGGITVIVERFTIQNGSTSYGSGISNYWSTLILNTCVVSGNTAYDSGGGINSYLGTVTLNNSTVSGNTANSGGGIYNQNVGTLLTLNNSTVSGNTANNGGGIYNYYGTVTLNNSTVRDNTANSGGGIHSAGDTVTLQNTILAGNTAGSAPDCYGIVGSSGYNLVGDTSGCAFTPGTDDLTNVNANLGQLIGVSGTPRYHPLLSGSPAIDAGNPTGCTGSTGPLITDQRGAARVGRCDIGAYEYTISGPPVSIYTFGGTPQHAPPSSTFGMALQAAVLDSIGTPVDNATVTFSAPASGASGTFVDSGNATTTALTGEGGIATAATFTANGLEGSYVVAATVGGVITPANFWLGNILWYVSPSGNDDNTCLSVGAACATINGVLGKPDFFAGDTVLVANGTYTGTGDEVVLLDKDVTLSGGWNGTFVTQSGTSTINGEGLRRGITVNRGISAIVERFTVQNSSTGIGGGILNDGVLTLNNSAISDNTAYGGGIYNAGTMTMTNSTVSGNTTQGHGDGGISNSGTLVLTNSTVSGNHDGGISNGGTLILNNSAVSGNTAQMGYGGGINSSGTLILNNSTISGNTGWSGGINNSGILTMTNGTISGNTASNGGGIYNSGGNVTLQNTILAGNTTSGTGPDCWGTFISAGYNLIGNTTDCDFTPTTGDLTNIDARLGPMEGSPGYHPLLIGSPAINAGNPTGCMGSSGLLTTDQRGFPRFGNCDIGAYELQPIGFSTKTATESTASPGNPLTYTIALSNGGATNITNVFVTDTLPISLTYVDNSITATGGSYDYNNEIITWTGSVSVGTVVTVTFGVTVSQGTPLGVSIINSAVISGGGEIITRSATIEVASPSSGTGPVYLPVVLKNQ